MVSLKGKNDEYKEEVEEADEEPSQPEVNAGKEAAACSASGATEVPKGEGQQKALATHRDISDAEKVESSVGTTGAASPQSPKVTPQKRKSPKSGVVYLSRVPPGMDIGALRSLLSRVGTLGRVWLRPESAASLAERRSLTGARRRTEFRDGWAEFVRRRDARRAVDLLNGQPMAGATRRGRWADDLWCMRLLRGYTWADLVDETCAGARERTLRVKAEVAAARRERSFVEERVAMAKRIERDEEAKRKPVRRFRQKRTIEEQDWEEDADERRAREAAERVDKELESGKGRTLDQELVSKLFKRRKRNTAEA